MSGKSKTDETETETETEVPVSQRTCTSCRKTLPIREHFWSQKLNRFTTCCLACRSASLRTQLKYKLIATNKIKRVEALDPEQPVHLAQPGAVSRAKPVTRMSWIEAQHSTFNPELDDPLHDTITKQDN